MTPEAILGQLEELRKALRLREDEERRAMDRAADKANCWHAAALEVGRLMCEIEDGMKGDAEAEHE